MDSFEWTITAAEHRLPIAQLLARRLPEISRTKLRRLIADGCVRVDGVPAPTTYRAVAGAQLSLQLTEPIISALLPEPLPLSVIYEDEVLLVVDKPAGLLVHPSASQKTGTLLNAISYHFKVTQQTGTRPGLVHRLDCQTSGIMVVAKTSRAHRILARQFLRRTVEKVYLALVIGVMPQPEGLIDAPIGYDPDSFPHWRILPAGRAAQTHFRVLHCWEQAQPLTSRPPARFSLLELKPQTGRTNQLRLHCALLGCPLVHDYVYGRTLNEALFGRYADAPTNSRHLLHAQSLGLRHPQDNDWHAWQAPLPQDMLQFMTSLKPLTEALP